MPFVIEFEDKYYIPVHLDLATKEKPTVSHSFKGCVECNSPVENKSYCPNCKKDVGTHFIAVGKKKEEVGSKEMWDFERINKMDIDLPRLYKVKYISLANIKKPKASEFAKWQQLQAKIGQSFGLKDLYEDLLKKEQVLKAKVVEQGKINDCYICPETFKVKGRAVKTLVAKIADGNLETITPEMEF